MSFFIKYEEARGFTKVLNITSFFLRNNWRLFRNIALIILAPIFILQNLLFNILPIIDINSIRELATQGGDIGTTLLSFIVGLFTGSLVFSVSYAFMQVYYDKLGNEFKIKDVWKEVGKNYPRMLGTTLTMLLLAIVSGIVVAIIGSIIGVSLMVSSPILGGFVMLFVIIAPLLFFFTVLANLYAVVQFENTDPFTAIGRCFNIMLHRGSFSWKKWSKTFALVFIVILLRLVLLTFVDALSVFLIFLDSFFALNEGFAEGMRIFGLVYYLIGQTFYMVILFPVFSIIFGFQYFSLVEQKEAKGLLKEIDIIGKEKII